MAHASEANITSCKQDVDGLGAYFSTDETVETLLLGDIPEHQWFDDNIYALVQIDDEGALHTVGPEVKRHPFLVRVDKPGIDIECIGLMAKVGDDADGECKCSMDVQTFLTTPKLSSGSRRAARSTRSSSPYLRGGTSSSKSSGI